MQRETQKAQKRPQNLLLEDRGRLLVSGVTDVDRFDEGAVLLFTDLGALVIRGQELHIDRIDLEVGEVAVTGCITALIYDESRVKGGFLARLLR